MPTRPEALPVTAREAEPWTRFARPYVVLLVLAACALAPTLALPAAGAVTAASLAWVAARARGRAR